MLQDWDDIDWLDQALHALSGALMTGLALLVMDWYWGIVLTMVVAVGREQWQHPLACHAGCRTDLLFWLVGIVVGVGVHLMAREILA